MEYESLIYDSDAGIATLTLNRPDKLNALIGAMREDVLHALGSFEADEAAAARRTGGIGAAPAITNFPLETLFAVSSGLQGLGDIFRTEFERPQQRAFDALLALSGLSPGGTSTGAGAPGRPASGPSTLETVIGAIGQIGGNIDIGGP